MDMQRFERNHAQRARTRTDAVIEDVLMRGTMLEYRERQVVALEKWAEKLEVALEALLEQGSAIHGDDLADARTVERARDVLASVKP